jgi:hypothetical protein
VGPRERQYAPGHQQDVADTGGGGDYLALRACVALARADVAVHHLEILAGGRLERLLMLTTLVFGRWWLRCRRIWWLGYRLNCRLRCRRRR